MSYTNQVLKKIWKFFTFLCRNDLEQKSKS